MTREEVFYDRIKNEFEGYMETIRDWDSDKLIDKAKYIGDYIRIYEYIMREKPISENSYLDYYERLKKPLETICDRYQEEKTPMDDLVNGTIWTIGKEQLSEDCYSEVKCQFLQRVSVNYLDGCNNNPSINARNLQFLAFEYIRCHMDFATDDEVSILMQFKNPLKVFMEAPPGENVENGKKISYIAEYLQNRDIMTMPYELDQFYLIPETKYRHNAINNINNMVLFPEFNITMNWLRLCRDISADDESIINPYLELINAFSTVSGEQGNNTLQQIYYMGKEHVILPNEIIEAAKYLADGGDINKVPKLAEYGYFECPYEDNHPADEFLATLGVKQKGMTMQ